MGLTTRSKPGGGGTHIGLHQSYTKIEVLTVNGLWAQLTHQEAEGLSASGACGLCVLVIVMPEIISARWG
jgi:hypothetical protein